MLLKGFPLERQMDLQDCGPACLKSIARYYGKFYSLQYLRERCGITRAGISLFALGHAAEGIGLRSLSIRTSMQDLHTKVPLPCIVYWDRSHFVVVYKVTRRNVYVADPAKGLLSYSHEEFQQHWYVKNEPKGILLALEPQADFMRRRQNEKLEQRKTFENIIGYFTPYRKSFVNLCVVMLFATLLQATLPFISKSVIDVGIKTHDIAFINMMIVANLVIMISLILSIVVRDWILLHVTARLNVALISDYLIKLMKIPVTFFETKSTGDILQRANDHERIRTFVMNNSLGMFFSSLTFLIFGIVLLVYNTTIFYLFLCGSTLYVCWVFFFLKIRKKLDWEYFDLYAKNQSYWVETIESIQDIKINSFERKRRWRWEEIQAQLYKVNTRILTVNNLQNSGAQLIDSMKNLLITFYCAKAVIAGEISFGIMISTQFIIGMLNGPVIQFIQFIVSAQFAHISFQRMNEIHQVEDEEESESLQNNIALPEDKSLFINNVSFRYTLHGAAILKNIHLYIPCGKVTAIVGDSGSGKSTLMKLLLRLYKVSYGEIMLGKMNINNISLKQWRDSCGAVMQDGKIFNDTVLNNITLHADEVDYSRVRWAADAANIAGEIERLSQGYQTVLGERGRSLSGGQKQRILIARALYKNPEYLFLDEATNALDSINEEKIVRALESAFKSRTVVVIAHRLSTIRNADQIVVMKGGAIVEIGPHEVLYQKKGHYYQLVKAQSGLEDSVAV